MLSRLACGSLHPEASERDPSVPLRCRSFLRPSAGVCAQCRQCRQGGVDAPHHPDSSGGFVGSTPIAEHVSHRTGMAGVQCSRRQDHMIVIAEGSRPGGLAIGRRLRIAGDAAGDFGGGAVGERRPRAGAQSDPAVESRNRPYTEWNAELGPLVTRPLSTRSGLYRSGRGRRELAVMAAISPSGSENGHYMLGSCAM